MESNAAQGASPVSVLNPANTKAIPDGGLQLSKLVTNPAAPFCGQGI